MKVKNVVCCLFINLVRRLVWIYTLLCIFYRRMVCVATACYSARANVARNMDEMQPQWLGRCRHLAFAAALTFGSCTK